MNAQANQLHSAMRTLRVHWNETREEWNDAVSRDFEERHIEPLEVQVNSVLHAMEKLSRVIAKARAECSSRGESE